MYSGKLQQGDQRGAVINYKQNSPNLLKNASVSCIYLKGKITGEECMILVYTASNQASVWSDILRNQYNHAGVGLAFLWSNWALWITDTVDIHLVFKSSCQGLDGEDFDHEVYRHPPQSEKVAYKRD